MTEHTCTRGEKVGFNIRDEAIPGDTAYVPDDQGKVTEDKEVQNWESSATRKN